MHKHKYRRRVSGPWHGLHGAVWMVGMAILFWHGWWWPGILVLVGINMLLESIFMQACEPAFENRETESQKTSFPPPPASPPTSFHQRVDEPGHRLELLPATCRQCGGPIRGHEVKWTGPQSAVCPFCGMNLPMKKI
jgi:hypothetical protein